MTLPALTPNQRHEAAQRLFLIIEKVKRGQNQPKGNGRKFYAELETKLSLELKACWKAEYTDALTEIFKFLPKEATQEAAELLERELLNALGPAFGTSPGVRRQMKKYIEAAYSSAKQEWTLETVKDKDSPLLSLPDRRAIEVLTRHNGFWLGEHYGEHIGPKIAELTRQALNAGLGRKALAEELKKELGGVAPKDYKYWDVASSAAIVRARSFGTISGMEEAGIAEYEILAMGDERMCPICGEMNGRVFSVAETRRVVNSVLKLDDPKAFKEAMPWQTKPATGMTSSKFTHSGQSLPPFHGRCRCTLIATDTAMEAASENNETEQRAPVEPTAPQSTLSSSDRLSATFARIDESERSIKNGKLCEYKGVEIVGGAVCADHIHMCLKIPPKFSVSAFMGFLKGKSTLMIFDRHPEFKKYGGRHFWARGYYVDTVGRNEEQILRYIKDQEESDKLKDD